MTKVTMPEPVAHQFQGRDGEWRPFIDARHHQNTEKDGSWLIRDLVTAEQAEAYAAAKVREAMEEAQSVLMAMYTDAVKARVPEAEDKEGWNESCLERALAISDATMKIRALIPN